MKSLQRCFCVLLSFLLLSIGFSSTVSAASVKVPEYIVTVKGYVQSGSFYTTPNISGLRVDPFDDQIQKLETVGSTGWVLDWRTNWIITAKDNSPLVVKGNSFDFTLSGAYYSAYLKDYDNSSNNSYVRDPTNIRVLITYSNGSQIYLDDENDDYKISFTRKGVLSDISFSFTPEYDIKEIEFILYNQRDLKQASYEMTVYSGEYDGTSYAVTVNQQSEESGLLSGLIGWVKNLFTSVQNGFSSIATNFSNMFSAISEGFSNIGTWFSELPAKIWALISDGLKSLFVPDDEFMTSYSDRWKELINSRFGAVVEVTNILHSSWDNIRNAEATGTILLPAFTLEDIGYDGYLWHDTEVKIVPDGFHYIMDYIHLIVAIVCTGLFVNGLLKRYEEVMNK